MLSETDVEDNNNPYVKLIEIGKNNSQCGFKLTRGRWDPYPWVSDVDEGTAAFTAGLKPGDCVLEVNGKDVVGMKICEIAEIVKSKNDQVSLLLWNAGIEPHCTPEAICCGPLPKNLQRLSACMSKILAYLECPVCLDTIPPPAYQCDNGHLICMRCRAKSEKCPVCRQRLQRGRSLISDQVYHAVTDTFGLKEDNEEMRSSKMQQIFKSRSKKPTVPEIKVTPTYTNKFLSRIIGKSSSVDNLSSDPCSNSEIGGSVFSDANLKTKSLSTNEIFLPESPVVSRSGSVSRITRKPLHTLSINYDYNKSSSCHGSFESLAVPKDDALETIEEPYCNCPFANDCNNKMKGTDLFGHFRNVHGENGPLVQYFSSHIRYSYKDLENFNDLCHMINRDDIFFLKLCFQFEEDKKEILPSRDIVLWVWYYGDETTSQRYEITIELKNKDEDVLLRVNLPFFSLTSTSHNDIMNSKKGAYINSKTLESLGFYSSKLFLDVKILNVDN